YRRGSRPLTVRSTDPAFPRETPLVGTGAGPLTQGRPTHLKSEKSQKRTGKLSGTGKGGLAGSDPELISKIFLTASFAVTGPSPIGQGLRGIRSRPIPPVKNFVPSLSIFLSPFPVGEARLARAATLAALARGTRVDSAAKTSSKKRTAARLSCLKPQS